jgi:hypothetical protein
VYGEHPRRCQAPLLQSQAVKSIGRRRVDCRRHSNPRAVWPVRVCADSFAAGVPHRDLLLSPDHAVFVDDVFIPIKYLVNGSTIVQIAVDTVTYFHIELPRHDVLLAEGLAAESYLDVGGWPNFGNGGGLVRLCPDFAAITAGTAAVWEADGYAPMVISGPQLEAVRERIAARDAALILAFA